MNGIKMSDCRFYVNEAERTIVCVIPNTGRMLIDYITSYCAYSDLDLSYAVEYDLKEKLKMPSSFMGKAVCDPNDEWNEEIGRKLAFMRAKNKCYTSFFRRANTFVQTIDRRLGDTIESFNNFGLKLEAKRKHLEDEVKDVIGEE